MCLIVVVTGVGTCGKLRPNLDHTSVETSSPDSGVDHITDRYWDGTSGQC